jgi:hypothetical protein
MIKNYRRYQRYSICVRAVITRRDEGSPERLTAQVNTISQGGMGFYTSVLLEKATPVSVELMFDSPEGPDILEGKIASVCSQGNDYFTGIAFDTDISHDRFVELIG